MNKELQATIRRAKQVYKRDGYPQIVLEDNDGTYSITRLYSDCWIFDTQKPIRIIDRNISFNKQVDIIGYLKKYNVKVVKQYDGRSN